MKFFIDSANIDEIREAASLGILDGVTTNPSLVAKEGKNFRKLLDEIERDAEAAAAKYPVAQIAPRGNLTWLVAK